MRPAVNTNIQTLLHNKLQELEQELSADIFSYFGPIVNGNENFVLKLIEDLASDAAKRDKIYVV